MTCLRRVQASNRYKMQLEGLEDQLLQRLADAPADILADVGLIEVGLLGLGSALALTCLTRATPGIGYS